MILHTVRGSARRTLLPPGSSLCEGPSPMSVPPERLSAFRPPSPSRPVPSVAAPSSVSSSVSARRVSRRALLAAAAIGTVGTAAAGTRAARATTVEPAPEASPDSASRPIVLWGSSSASSYASALTDDFRVVRLDTELTSLLDVPASSQALPAAKSPETLLSRSEKAGLDLDFSYLGAGGVLPGSGRLVLSTLDKRTPNSGALIPGSIAGVPCTIRAIWGRQRKVLVERDEPGRPVEVGYGRRGRWTTSLEARHRGSTHLLWMGKNNIQDVDRVLADTRAAYDVEPETTLVMGHWKTNRDRPGTATHDAVDRVNRGYASAFGDRWIDIHRHLSDPRWWDLPELRHVGIGRSDEDRRRLGEGVTPRTIMADDGVHLNRFGYLIVAHALAEHLRSISFA